MHTAERKTLAILEAPVERDHFLCDLIRELSGTLQDVVGMEEAAGFISVVGQRVGDSLDQRYRAALGAVRLSREQVSAVLVDLKRRIGGDFFVLEERAERIVLGNCACPFGDRVLGRPALCMMTSNVFGRIAAENLGYARVELRETIAEGACECRVVVHLLPPEEGEGCRGREYVRG